MPGPISYVKMSADLDTNPKVRRAGRNGRDVYLFVLRRVAVFRAQGRIPVSNVDTWYLADQLQMTELEAEQGLTACLKRHRNPVTGEEESPLLSISDGEVFVTGWDDDWARYPLTEAERKAAERARKKDDSEPTGRCKTCRTALPARHVSPRCQSCDDLAARADRPMSAMSGQSGQRPILSGIPSDLDLDPSTRSEDFSNQSSTHTHFDPNSWNPEPTDANTFAELEARRIGASIEVQLKRFRAHARKKHWTAERMSDEWGGWLAIAKPTPDDLRKAHTAVAARDRERRENEQPRAPPVSDEDRLAMQRQLELNKSGLYVVSAETTNAARGDTRGVEGNHQRPAAKEATG